MPANAGAQEHAAAASAPHIAVLLPIRSGPFVRAADAVRRGVWEAHRVQNEPALPIVLYATSDDPLDVAKVYHDALGKQARFVIGPLTRSAVSALAAGGPLAVPTLALNVPESETGLPDGLFVFGLQVEHEARHVAGLAHDRGLRRAMVVSAQNALSRRLAQSFVLEWTDRGGEVVREEEIVSDPTVLAGLRESVGIATPDMVFFALDAQMGRLARSYLGQSIYFHAA